MKQQPVTYFPFRIGAVECAALSAGTGYFRVAAFFADLPPDELNPVLARHGIQTEKIETPFNVLLIRHQGLLILVDTGAKAAPLIDSLARRGIAPEDVDMVILSHWHADHSGGAFNDGEPTFPNARHIISRIDGEQARERLATLSPQLLEPGTEVLGSITMVSAPGHTAGQIALKIQSRGETLLYTGDVIAHPIHLERPQWNIISDEDRAQARETRAALLNQAADNGWWLFVYHFPFPGLCRIRRAGAGWAIIEQRAVMTG